MPLADYGGRGTRVGVASAVAYRNLIELGIPKPADHAAPF